MITSEHAPHTGAPNYRKQILVALQGKEDNNKIIAGDRGHQHSAVRRLGPWCSPSGPNGHLPDLPSNSDRTHILLKLM